MAVVLLDKNTLDLFRYWSVGSLSGRDETRHAAGCPVHRRWAGAGVLVARPLNTMGLGEDTARALGTNVGWTRAATALAVALLCGAATAACGPIGFIGLVVPLAARSIAGPDQRWLLPYSAVLGPVVLLAATWSAA